MSAAIHVLLFVLCCLPLLAVGGKLVVPPYQADENVVKRNYEGVNLSLSNFSGTNASGSSFVNAQLDYANLSLANFSNTNLTNVSLKLALVEYTNFMGAKGLTPTQLAEACLPLADEEEKLGLEEFDLVNYSLPEGCQIWEHIPRG